MTSEQRKSRNRANKQALAILAVLLVPIALSVYTGSGVFMYLGLLWVLPIIIATELGESRGRNGWLWGFFLGWLGVLILACMSNPNRAHQLRDPQLRDLQVRELEVRELEAKVRLAELRQAGQEQFEAK